MRILPPSTCWRFAGGRIINLHHGLLPSFPGFRPYEDAFSHHMLTYGEDRAFHCPGTRCGQPDNPPKHIQCLPWYSRTAIL
jgi:formyltetrahydrofolate deformylase